jgi:hypothetical protein
MTLDALVQRQQRVQAILVDLTRGRETETNARDKLRKAGLSPNEIERLLQAVRANIITPRSA